MTDHIALNHARVFDTRWGQGLASIELDDGNESLRLQLCQPILEGGGNGAVARSIGLSDEASEEAHETMSQANRAALIDMTDDKFEAAIESAGFAGLLDELAAKYPLK